MRWIGYMCRVSRPSFLHCYPLWCCNQYLIFRFWFEPSRLRKIQLYCFCIVIQFWRRIRRIIILVLYHCVKNITVYLTSIHKIYRSELLQSSEKFSLVLVVIIYIIRHRFYQRNLNQHALNFVCIYITFFLII